MASFKPDGVASTRNGEIEMPCLAAGLGASSGMFHGDSKKLAPRVVGWMSKPTQIPGNHLHLKLPQTSVLFCISSVNCPSRMIA